MSAYKALTAALCLSVFTPAFPISAADRWQLTRNGSISWDIATDTHLPHDDHLEMSGRRVSVVVTYGVDPSRHLTWKPEIYWPTLRIKPHDVRAYLHHVVVGDQPAFKANGSPLELGSVRMIRFNGILTVEYEPVNGLSLVRNIFPSPDAPAIVERFFIRNDSKAQATVSVSLPANRRDVTTIRGPVTVVTRLDSDRPVGVAPGQTASFSVVTSAGAENDRPLDPASAQSKREALLQQWADSLVLHTPDPVLNQAFGFAKIRAAESIFDTAIGVVHSPGGGRYYGGVWANDQVEYAGPFFPFLGYKLADDASLNAYLIFGRFMKPDYERLPSSIEVEGDVVVRFIGDRGDAAMLGYGASRFALALGDRATAEKLWPEITWALEYCRRKTNSDGVVASDTDEMEGRLPTGHANLSTSVLTYGALTSASLLGHALGHDSEADTYQKRAGELRSAIERYFGRNVQGYETYRYYDGNTNLRHWICLPLTVGILDRAPGTIDALLKGLWTSNGLVTQSGDTQFWDRGTLYALRGLFQAGATAQALSHLTAYTHERLLGEHVPYAVEAYPEGSQAHLSAESALYARIYTEGLFGILPTGLHSFRAVPRLPDGWHHMRLDRIHAFENTFDMDARREAGKGIHVEVSTAQGVVLSQTRPAGEAFEVKLQ